MANQKKKKNTGVIVAITIVIFLLFAGGVTLILINSTKNKKTNTSTMETQQESEIQKESNDGETETVEETEESIVPFSIETKYGNLYYPNKWENVVRTEISEAESYEILFYATIEGKEDIHIFDVTFNGDGVEVDKRVTEDGETLSICVVSYDLDLDDSWKDTEKEIVYAMCEDINYLIGQLDEIGKSYYKQQIDAEIEGDFEISTDYGVLYYPKQWEEKIYTEINKDETYTVSFFADFEDKEKIHLFDVVFDGNGDSVGEIELDNGDIVTVCIESYELNLDESWTEDEENDIYVMMEDVNYLLNKLFE